MLSELEVSGAHILVLEIPNVWGAGSSAPLTVTAQGAGGRCGPVAVEQRNPSRKLVTCSQR